jgi:RES domain-containing protein
VLGSAEVPDDISRETVREADLPADWQTLNVAEQHETRKIGNDWIGRSSSAVLFVPSVVTGETNLLINPEHGDFGLIKFLEPVPFVFDLRLLSRSHLIGTRKPTQGVALRSRAHLVNSAFIECRSSEKAAPSQSNFVVRL